MGLRTALSRDDWRLRQGDTVRVTVEVDMIPRGIYAACAVTVDVAGDEAKLIEALRPGIRKIAFAIRRRTRRPRKAAKR